MKRTARQPAAGPSAAAAGRPAPRREGRAPRPGGPAEADRVSKVLEPVVRSAGLDLESVRVAAAGRRRLLRVVVDADGGPSLDDIALLSRSLSAELDSSGVMGETAYTLEVSSPGVGRPLTEPRHWRRAHGRLVRVPLAPAAPGGPETIQGRVIGAGPATVTLEIDGQQRDFGYQELGPGQVQVEFGGGAGLSAGHDEPADEGEPDGH
ncbi:MAG TPA: ribosome maturation factor RimP [Streptosporangiaceae bacterium]|nr:ribosome maturation factor RimP [Streptosporangiaceae bacterium]